MNADVESVFRVPSKPSKSSPKRKSRYLSDHSNFIYVLFLFLYYFLLSPFRLKRVRGLGGQGYFEIHSWRPQKISCGCFVAIGLLRNIRIIWEAYSDIRKNNPVAFLTMFGTINRICMRIAIFIGFWRKQEKYLKLANFLSDTSSNLLLSYEPFNIESTKFLVLLHSLVLIREFLAAFLGFKLINIWDWSPTWVYKKYLEEARYVFFLNSKGNFTNVPEHSTFTGTDHFITVVHILSKFVFYLMQGIYLNYFVSHVWSLWAPVTVFADSMYEKLSVVRRKYCGRDEEFGKDLSIVNEEFSVAFKQFNFLKNLSILVMETIGDAILQLFLHVIFVFAVLGDRTLLTQDSFTKVYAISFYILTFIVLVCSAEIVRKMRWFETWLCEECRGCNVDQNKLGIVFQDLAANRVGISAAGMFTITYSTLGTVGALIVTYFIIKLQS